MPVQLFINIAVVGFAFFSGLFYLKKLDGASRIIFVFTLVALFTEIRATFQVLQAQNNMLDLRIYVIIEFMFWALYFRKKLSPLIRKSIVTTVIIIFEIFAIYRLFSSQDLNSYPNVLRAVEGLILVVFAVLLLLQIMQEAKIERLWKEPVVLVNIAVLFYFAGNFFFNIFFNIIFEYSREFSRLTSYYFIGLNILFYLLIATSFLLQKKKESTR